MEGYPDWVLKVMHPELDNVGPTHYKLPTDVALCFYPGQEQRVVKGYVIYLHLVKGRSMGNYLGYRDAVAIQKMDPVDFRNIFGLKAIFFWKTVVHDRADYLLPHDHYIHLYVPCLYISPVTGELLMCWRALSHDWDSWSPAIRFVRDCTQPMKGELCLKEPSGVFSSLSV